MPRHLIPSFDPALTQQGACTADRVKWESATPLALPRTSAFPLPNDSTAGTAGTV